jgi:hypothetical protein
MHFEHQHCAAQRLGVVGAVGVHRGGGEGGRRGLHSSAVEGSAAARGLRR